MPKNDKSTAASAARMVDALSAMQNLGKMQTFEPASVALIRRLESMTSSMAQNSAAAQATAMVERLATLSNAATSVQTRHLSALLDTAGTAAWPENHTANLTRMLDSFAMAQTQQVMKMQVNLPSQALLANLAMTSKVAEQMQQSYARMLDPISERLTDRLEPMLAAMEAIRPQVPLSDLGIDFDRIRRAIEALPEYDPDVSDSDAAHADDAKLYEAEYLDEIASAVADALPRGAGSEAMGYLAYMLTMAMLVSWWAAVVFEIPKASTAATITGYPGLQLFHAVAVRVRERIRTGFEPSAGMDADDGDTE